MIQELKSRIKEIISRSPLPEDPLHSENTLKWLLYLQPSADEALRISALGHDIERAMEDIKIRREDYKDYSLFKEAHAKNSAKVLQNMMMQMGLDKHFSEDVYHLVSHHEKGGYKRADLLKNADSISFFEVNLPFYYEREGRENTLQRAIYGYRKITPIYRDIIRRFNYTRKELNDIIKQIINNY